MQLDTPLIGPAAASGHCSDRLLAALPRVPRSGIGSWHAHVMSSDPGDEWTMFHFSQSNPDGPGQGDVPALLRRVADSIEALGDVMVEDITFSSEPTADERDVSMAVYYHRDHLA
jgi:hypothetical protein